MTAMATKANCGSLRSAPRHSGGKRAVNRLSPRATAWDEHNALVAKDDGAEGAPDGPLGGLTAVVKDNLCTKGTRTTAGSASLAKYVPPFDATAVARLRQAGAALIGKANLDEFAMGSSTEFSSFGPTHNPIDADRVPGGSSGGSAAAVTSGLCDIALGSDTGGSIRQPAAFCGCVGLKPTYGLVPRHGLVAYASSLDTVGPLGRSVESVTRCLGQIAGADGYDQTASAGGFEEPEMVPPERMPAKPLEGKRLGLFDPGDVQGVEDVVKARFNEAADTLERLGAIVERVRLPSFEAGLPAYYIIAPSEASSNLARYDGIRYGSRSPSDSFALPESDMSLKPFQREGPVHEESPPPTLAEAYARARSLLGPEVIRRILAGTYTLSAGYADAYYARAQLVRSIVRSELEDAMRGKSAILLPTTPTTAFR